MSRYNTVKKWMGAQEHDRKATILPPLGPSRPPTLLDIVESKGWVVLGHVTFGETTCFVCDTGRGFAVVRGDAAWLRACERPGGYHWKKIEGLRHFMLAGLCRGVEFPSLSQIANKFDPPLLEPYTDRFVQWYARVKKKAAAAESRHKEEYEARIRDRDLRQTVHEFELDEYSALAALSSLNAQGGTSEGRREEVLRVLKRVAAQSHKHPEQKRGLDPIWNNILRKVQEEAARPTNKGDKTGKLLLEEFARRGWHATSDVR